MENLLLVKNRYEFRDWLMRNHNTETECWINVKRGKPKDDNIFWYLDAVEEALCFGWIDSTVKRLDNGAVVQRLSPRKKNSSWSELNKERCRRMEKLGKMTDFGRNIFPDIPFVINKEILKKLQSNKVVWKNFCNFHPLYQRVRIDTIQTNKNKRSKLFKMRLEKFIKNTESGIMYGNWNDYGRLLEC